MQNLIKEEIFPVSGVRGEDTKNIERLIARGGIAGSYGGFIPSF